MIREFRLYDTENVTLIYEAVTMTPLSGKICIKLFLTPEGNWFQTIEPKFDISGQLLMSSEILNPETARRWLEKRCFNRQIREYFGSMGNRLQPDRLLIVSEFKSLVPAESP